MQQTVELNAGVYPRADEKLKGLRSGESAESEDNNSRRQENVACLK